MAKRTQTYFISDISGAESNVSTSLFSFNGSEYEIDLTAKETEKLADLLKPYINAGRKASTRTARKKSVALRKPGPSGPSAQVIRTWALAHGHKIPKRGRIPQNIRASYTAANS